MFRSYVRFRKISSHTVGGFTPPQLREIYNFPAGFDGSGKKVGFIELGGSFNQEDLDSYFKSLGLKSPKVEFVGIDGQVNTPDTPQDADVEVMLDLCSAIGVANGITPIVFLASNSDQGFTQAIDAAVSSKVDAISISWGGPENQWDSNGIAIMSAAIERAANAGIPVFVAAGDNGSGDGEKGNHVDFPGSCPFAISCGGTSLVVNNGKIISETVWNDGTNGGATGGGVSTLFKLPSYQTNSKIPGNGMRGVPDVAGVADPETGIFIIADGQTQVVGGTSGVAPFWAGLYCVLSQAAGKNLGFLNPLMYPLEESCFRDITQGNNGTYVARVGWDCCTGLGVPVGTKLLEALKPTPTPTPTPVPTPTPKPATDWKSKIDNLFAALQQDLTLANMPQLLAIVKAAQNVVDTYFTNK
jgi:kumamolisin